MAGLNAGDLDREIVLQTASPVQSESGEVSMDWANATSETIWAEWIPGSTSEGYLQQRQIGSHIDGVYRIYYRDEPLPDRTRIIDDRGRIFDVKPAIEIERGVGWLVPVVARGEL